jgi:predicted nucleic acid-binding protein
VYACLYLALAEAEQTSFVTADMHLLGKLQDTSWERWATNLSGYSLGS